MGPAQFIVSSAKTRVQNFGFQETMSREERKYVDRGGYENFYLIDADTGSRVFASSYVFDNHICCSPDGNFVLLIRDLNKTIMSGEGFEMNFFDNLNGHLYRLHRCHPLGNQFQDAKWSESSVEYKTDTIFEDAKPSPFNNVHLVDIVPAEIRTVRVDYQLEGDQLLVEIVPKPRY